MADESVNTQQAERPVGVATPQEQPAAVAAAGGAQYIWGTGRRKKAVARVRIRTGSGKFLVNRRELDEYFKSPRDRASARSPLETTKLVGGYDVFVNVTGGGMTGQADAVKLGLARALGKVMPDILPALREHRLLTRDARMKERKKYGQKGARKRFQFSKR